MAKVLKTPKPTTPPPEPEKKRKKTEPAVIEQTQTPQKQRQRIKENLADMAETSPETLHPNILRRLNRS